jgi:hypothetical protein
MKHILFLMLVMTSAITAEPFYDSTSSSYGLSFSSFDGFSSSDNSDSGSPDAECDPSSSYCSSSSSLVSSSSLGSSSSGFLAAKDDRLPTKKFYVYVKQYWYAGVLILLVFLALCIYFLMKYRKNNIPRGRKLNPKRPKVQVTVINNESESKAELVKIPNPEEKINNITPQEKYEPKNVHNTDLELHFYEILSSFNNDEIASLEKLLTRDELEKFLRSKLTQNDTTTESESKSEPVIEIKTVIPPEIFYLSGPVGNTFNVSNIVKEENDDSLYCFHKEPNTDKALVYVIDNPRVSQKIIRSIKHQEGVCDDSGELNSNTAKIETETPGEAILDGNKWCIVKKIKIRCS